MDKELRDMLTQTLIDCNALKTWKETVKSTVHTEVSEEVSPDNIRVAPNGLKYKKKELSSYLMEKGLPFTEEYVNMAAKQFPAEDYEIDTTESVIHNEMENICDEDLNVFLMAKLVEQISKFRGDYLNQGFFDYKIEVINDRSSGSTNINELTRVIERYSENGWALKHVFSNELGEDSHVVGNVRYNSTIDEIILIFERPAYITDHLANKLRKDIREINAELRNHK